MDKIFTAYDIAKANSIKGDFIDRLHSRYTVVFFFLITIIVVLKQNNGDAIICWFPNQLSGDQVSYARQLCWVNNTYYYPAEKDADLFPENLKYVIKYYQFIIFILFAQALLFYFPTLIWRGVVSDSAGYINKLLDQVEKNKVASVIHDELKKNKMVRRSPRRVRSPASQRMPPLEKQKEAEAEGEEHEKEHEAENGEHKLLVDTKIIDETNENQELENEHSSLYFPADYKDKFKTDFRSLMQLERSRSKLKQTNQPDVHIEDDENVSEQPKFGYESRQASRFSRGISKLSNLSKKKILSFMKPSRGVKHLAKSYLLLKLLNLLNVIVQIFFLRFIFGAQFWLYGIEVVTKLIKNKDPFELSTQFPIITFCDYFVHQNLRQVHFYSVQCLLSINVLIEKFYVLIWFWLAILLVVTLINLLSWTFEIILFGKVSFLKKYIQIKRKMIQAEESNARIDDLLLKSINTNSMDEEKSVKRVRLQTDVRDLDRDLIIKFYETSLGIDGYVMLHIIKSVAGDIVFMEMLYELWVDFEKEKYQ